MGFCPEGQTQGYECRVGREGCCKSNLTISIIQIPTKATVRDLEWTLRLHSSSRVWKSCCSHVGLKIWKAWSLEVSCQPKGVFYHVVSPLFAFGTHQLSSREKLRYKNRKGQLQTGASTLTHFPSLLMINVFFHGSVGAQSPRWAGERIPPQWSSGLCEQENNSESVDSAHFLTLLPEMLS